MKHSIKTWIALLTICAMVLTTQIINIASSFAVGPVSPQGTSGDLSIVVGSSAKDRAFTFLVCNNGTDTIINFVVEIATTNYEITDALALPTGFESSNSTDNGDFDFDTGAWNGVLDGSQCVALGAIGNVTGPLGTNIVATATILSSTLSDSTPNIDPDSSNDTDSFTSAPIALDPDLALETRLLTSGTITNGTEVEYELTLKNVGEGQYIEAGGGDPFGIYFILPEGTTYLGVTDEDPTDNIDVNNATCGSMGGVSGVFPAFTSYSAELAGCQLSLKSGFMPAGDIYKLKFKMTANGPFSVGDSEVFGFFVADDMDSIMVQLKIFTPSSGPFTMEDNNNFVSLGFDNAELRATVNRCAGTSEVVTTNTACFTISFNKEIYAPNFDASDIVVENGEVESLTPIGENLWQIKLKNLVAGQITSVALSSSNNVLDYSAVNAQTAVLGINTVRYIATDSKADGVASALPNTGSDTTQLIVCASLLLGAGLVMIASTKKRKAKTL